MLTAQPWKRYLNGESHIVADVHSTRGFSPPVTVQLRPIVNSFEYLPFLQVKTFSLSE